MILGRLEGIHAERPQPLLCKKNHVRTIHGSVAIEGNPLTPEQVTAILEGKRVIAPKKEIQEIVNANELYEKSVNFDYRSEGDFLKAHQILMKGMIDDAGRYRATAVGVSEGSKVVHVAPKGERVPQLMKDLFYFLNHERDTTGIILSAVFHYEVEFIHPFLDGNGRIGRFWQHLVLQNLHSLFQYLPIESMIHKHQKNYYEALKISDQKGECTDFIEFSLRTILETLTEFEKEVRPQPMTAEARLKKGQESFGLNFFSRREYIGLFKTISTATASRDLEYGINKGHLEKVGSKATTKYRFKK